MTDFDRELKRIKELSWKDLLSELVKNSVSSYIQYPRNGFYKESNDDDDRLEKLYKDRILFYNGIYIE
jgi:hypothetical protein